MIYQQMQIKKTTDNSNVFEPPARCLKDLKIIVDDMRHKKQQFNTKVKAEKNAIERVRGYKEMVVAFTFSLITAVMFATFNFVAHVYAKDAKIESMDDVQSLVMTETSSLRQFVANETSKMISEAASLRGTILHET